MYAKGIPYSPPTVTLGVTAVDGLSIRVVDISAFPVLAPGEHTYAVLSATRLDSEDPEDFETVKVTAVVADGYYYGDSGTLTIADREVEGIARQWPDGTAIACLLTDAGWDELTGHEHGNVTNDGKVGADANIPLITGADGLVQAGSFGSGENTFCEGDDGRLSDNRTPANHNLVDTTKHPVSGLTAGHFLKATDDDAYAFAAHGLDATAVGLGNVTNHAQLALAGGTMSGELIMADQLLTKPLLKDYGETAVVATGVNGNQTINLENGNVIQHTLDDATTYTFSNPPASGRAGSFTLIIIQPAAHKAVTWPASVSWVGGLLPDLAVNSGRYVLTFMTVDAGTVWYGFVAGDDMKAAS